MMTPTDLRLKYSADTGLGLDTINRLRTNTVLMNATCPECGTENIKFGTLDSDVKEYLEWLEQSLLDIIAVNKDLLDATPNNSCCDGA